MVLCVYRPMTVGNQRGYTMSTILTITLPDSFVVHSRGVDYTFYTGGLPADMVAMGAIHGFTQKLADSLADKAKVAGKEADVVEAVWDTILSGEWTRRRASGEAGMSELDVEIHRIARAKVQAAFMAKHGVKAVKALTDEQTKAIDALTPKLAERDYDVFKPLAEAAIAARKAIKAVTGDVDLAGL